MRILNFIIGTLIALLAIFTLFRFWMVVTEVMRYGLFAAPIIPKALSLVAAFSLFVFFFRSNYFDNGTDGCQGKTKLRVMKSASLFALIACLCKLAETVYRLTSLSSPNEITIVYALCECLLWLALSLYFFVYWRDKHMKLGEKFSFSMDYVRDLFWSLVPENSKVRYLKRWKRNTTLDSCGKVTVKRTFRLSDIYIDLYWFVTPAEGGDVSLKSNYYRRVSWESMREILEIQESQIEEDYRDR